METTHFQEEWINRGLLLEHNKEEGMVPIMDTCLGYTTVLGLSSSTSKSEWRKRSVFLEINCGLFQG